MLLMKAMNLDANKILKIEPKAEQTICVIMFDF